MSLLGRRYTAVHVAVGLPVRSRLQVTTTRQAPPDEIRRVVEGAPGGAITAAGVVSLALLLWPMILIPF